MKNKTLYVCCIIVFATFFACSSRIHFRVALDKMEKKFQHHIGFMLYNPIKKNTIIAFNEKKHFTPASNIKILTFYGGLQLLGDSIPALRYIQKKDSLIFWATGDPSFLYNKMYSNMRVFNWMKNSPSNLYFSPSNFHAKHFGPGWSWDDYNYSFSSERSPFPIYGNCIDLIEDTLNQLSVSPPYFQDKISFKKQSVEKKRAIRLQNFNQFIFYRDTSDSLYAGVVPFHTDPKLTVKLLSDTLKRKVTLLHYPLPHKAKTIYSIVSDSLYRPMLQDSDNFIAEQLLLMCSGLMRDTLKSSVAIDYIKKKYFFDLLDDIEWVDGSGLSRYNLLTPQSIVQVWEKIESTIPKKRLFSLLAVGGKSGTLKSLYKKTPPYIYGKTGTLSNNHCLSGYIVTKKGNTLIFSFMNNNFVVPVNEIYRAMEKLLLKAYDKF